MKGRQRGISTVAIIVIVLVIAAVLGAVYVVTRPAEKKIKVGLILATGGLGDKSFNDSCYAGAKRAEAELGIQIDYVEPKAIAEYEGFQRDFAKTGEYAIIVCIGFDQADALTTIASEYPNENFAIVDMVVDKPNVASLLFKANEGGFLLGVVAAEMTTTNKLGIVGGMDIPLIHDFFIGFENGAKWANPNVTISTVYVGEWANPTKGKELALSLIDAGADFIWAAAGKSGLGALAGAAERGVYTAGVDACQCHLYPAHMPASMTKRVDVAVYEMIKAAVEGKFQGGIYSKGLKDGWVGLCRLPEEQGFWENTFGFTHQVSIPADVMAKVLDAKAKIENGEIVVPRPPGWT